MWSTKTCDGEVHVLVVPPNVPIELLYEPLELVEEFYETRSAYNPSDCIQMFVGSFLKSYKQLCDIDIDIDIDIDEPLLILLSRDEAEREVTSVVKWLEETQTICYTNVGVRGNWER